MKMTLFNVSYCLLMAVFLILQATEIGAQDNKYWVDNAMAQLNDVLKYKPIVKPAKNVILFVGDGMGISTVTASRIYKGQKTGNAGVDDFLSFEKFPNIALSKTYNTDIMTPDSAATATAMFTGIKTIYGGIGVDARARKNNCSTAAGTELTTILDWSLLAGKRAGFVTTTRVTHATPASIYAHTVGRDWEAPYGIQKPFVTNTACRDIARQLVEDNFNIHVAFGGGRMMFLPTNITDLEVKRNGSREDGRDLITEWKQKQQSLNRKFKYIWDTADFHQTDAGTIDYALGLFGFDHLEYELDRKANPNVDPSLANMTTKAIQILNKGTKGYFLMVEGGRIDHAHHSTVPHDALEDTVALHDAVKAAVGAVNLEETLIIVTSDHSHTFTMGGYPRRGSPILGSAVTEDDQKVALDNMTFPILSYANGPFNGRKNFTFEEMMNRSIARPTMTKLTLETHGGEDVGIFAQGPMAHLFRGVVEQSYIAHVIAYASCVGPYNTKCAEEITFPIPSSTVVEKGYLAMVALHIAIVLVTTRLLS